MGAISYLDTLLVPMSLFLTVGYHAYLWHNFKNKTSLITFGINTLRRRVWFQDIKEGDEKKRTLAVQSLRNTLMGTILTATIANLINLLLAALANNAYNASHLLNNAFFGSQSSRLLVLKYGAASLFLLVSFLCSSMSLGYLIDANFLVNADGEDFACVGGGIGYTQMIFERGFLLAVVGNRMLCITFPLLLWMFGPVPVALSSVALIWGFYELDYASNAKIYKQRLP